MRVSSLSQSLTTTQALSASLDRVRQSQQQVATGKALARWSDDPAAASAAERYRAEEADYAMYDRSANDAQSWLGTADGTLQSMSSIMARVKQLAISATSGTLTQASRDAIADEVTQLRDQLRDLGNTTYLGRSLFGGFSTAALGTDAAGAVTYTGDAGEVKRQVSPTVTVTVNVSAHDVFGFAAGAGQDLFSQLDQLATAARAGNSAGVLGVQSTLEARHGDILTGLGKVGAVTNRVDVARAAGTLATQDLAQRRSEFEDVDIAEAVMQLSSAQAGYQAALAAASRANLPSLADFLR
jgi:flagellar hook-associated protein 3 FlgL